MKSLNKLTIAGVLATAAVSAFAQNLEGTPPQVIGLDAVHSDRARAEVRAEARQPQQAPAYLVTGDTFTPVSRTLVGSGDRSRPEVRAEARQALHEARVPAFIGG